MFRIQLLSHFLFLVPPLLWNVLFTHRLPMDHFGGEAPAWILIPEGLFRALAMVYPVLFPLSTKRKSFRGGLLMYLLGLLAYFASWTYLMEWPDSELSQQTCLRFAPAYLPLIWFMGIERMMGSRIYIFFVLGFIALHVGEYVFRY